MQLLINDRKKGWRTHQKVQWFLPSPLGYEAMRSKALNTQTSDYFNNNIEHFPRR